ncbi:putative transposable element [Trichonephila clavipes]|nr:putative transposable element [Trichonephila clavipes]
MKSCQDIEIVELLNDEITAQFQEQRDALRQDAKKQIYKVQDENRGTYNLRRRQAHKYQLHDLVAIKRTQFGPGLKLKQKYLGPYKVTRGGLPGHDGRCRVGYVQWTTSPPVLRVEQVHTDVTPRQECPTKRTHGKICRRTCQVIYSQFGLAIHQNDHQARRRFVEWAQNEIAIVPDFHKRILFSDEAHFWLNGYVNKQNWRIWSEANPQVPQRYSQWGSVLITNFFIPELNNHDVQELWFQQDGATCHTARATIDLLKDTFGDRLISRFGSVNWPPRSCDLTPLDYFLWGYVKSLVYADKPQTLDHLEDNIRRVIANIRPQMLEKVIENWTSRIWTASEPAVAVICQNI